MQCNYNALLSFPQLCGNFEMKIVAVLSTELLKLNAIFHKTSRPIIISVAAIHNQSDAN